MHRSFSAVFFALLLIGIGPVAKADQNGQIQQGDPQHSNGGGSGGGSTFSLGNGNAHGSEPISASLDAVASAPANFNNKAVVRRVVFTSDLVETGSVFTVGVRDAETGKQIAPGFSSGLSFVVLPDMANRLGRKIDSMPNAIVTFTVAEIPMPSGTRWAAVISRVEILDGDGSVSKTIEAR